MNAIHGQSMKLAWSLLLLLSFFFTGCGGGNDPVNLDKDKPKTKKTMTDATT